MYICIYVYMYNCIHVYRYPIAFGPPAPGPRDVGMSGCMVSLAGWLVG